MTDAEILRIKLNSADCALDDQGKEEFLAKTDNFSDVFSLRDEMDRLKHLGIIQKGLTGYSSPVVLVKWKNQNLYSLQ